jgi:hypothetical protein
MAFVPGIELSRRYFHDCAEPILTRGSLGRPGRLTPRITTYSELVRRPGDPRAWRSVAPLREFPVINAEELAETIRAEIRDRNLAELHPAGAADQISDNTDLLEWPALTHAAIEAVSLPREALTRT